MADTKDDALAAALRRPGAHRALALAAGHINVSIADPVAPERLLACLLDVPPGELRDRRVGTFLDEIDTATIADLVISGAVPYRQLAHAAAIHLAEDHETRRWLDERKAF